MNEPARSRDGQHAVSGLRSLPETVLVWGVDTYRLSTNWTVIKSCIALKSGSPLGAITYRHHTTGRQVTVAVRWNFFRGELQCRVMDGVLEPGEQADVERDARHRVGALVAAYADLGSRAAPDIAEMSKIAGLAVGEPQHGGAAASNAERAGHSAHDVDGAEIA